VRLRTLTVPCAALALALAAPAAPALAHSGGDVDKVVMKDVLIAEAEGVGTNMKAVANLPYDKTGATSMSGSDIEFGRIGGRDYAFAGTLRNGLQIVDITTPTKPVKVAVFDCQITQGDVQVFPQGNRVLATYTADSTYGPIGAESKCAKDLGLTAADAGTVIVDVTNPAKPTSVGFAPVKRGSHNMTVHPSGRYLFNSNSDLITSTDPTIVIYDIADPSKPKLVQEYRIPFVPASLGSESHDITFNADGTRAYSAALSQTLIFDTTDPEKPKQISQIIDPTVQVSHGADPITLTKKDGSKRTLLMISDEQAGAAAGTNCPGGGVHVYDITGDLEKAPKKLGIWFIGEKKPSSATCTAHVFRMHSEQGLFTIAWYDQGVRVVDVAGLADLPTPTVPFVTSGDGNGIKEIGKYVFTDSNTWSFKTNAIAADGSFFGFGNDLGRGFDVYRFQGLGRTVPPLVPVELRSGAAAPAQAPAAAAPQKRGAAVQPAQGSGTAAQQPATAALPTTGTSGLATGAVLVLTVVTAGMAVARRRRATV
jgi:hypothetical protein